MDPRPTLNYAPVAHSKNIRRDKIERICKLILLLLLLPVFGYICLIVALSVHQNLVYGRARAGEELACRRYTAPPTLVVYEEDPIAAAALLNQQGYTTLRASHPRRPAATVFVPSCWETYIGSPGGAWGCALLFLHELPGKSGPKLVAIQLRTDKEFCLFINGLYTHTLPIPADSPGTLRFYAGQLDPTDPSRFSIRYAVNNKEGLVRGRFNPSTEMVEWDFPAQASAN
jgi:hypothetical protein